MNKKTRMLLTLIILFFVIANVSTKAVAAEDNVKVAIITGIENINTEVDISEYNIKTNRIRGIMSEIFSENPQLFYVKDAYSYTFSGDKVTGLKFNYIAKKNRINKMKLMVEKKIRDMKKFIDPNWSEEEIALAVHDYLALNCEYDYDGYLDNKIGYNSYTIYGALIKEKAVCLGYALAYQYILEKVYDIDCYVVTSQSMNHAWNMVKIGHKFYHVDVTWDDSCYDSKGSVLHKAFLLSDERMKAEGYHDWDGNLKATDESYDNYFWREVSSGILYFKEKWYYVGKDFVIYEYNFVTGKSSKVSNIEECKWYVMGTKSYYDGCFSKLTMVNDKFYYNTSTAIYEVQEDGSSSLVYVPDTTEGYIYGLWNDAGDLIYQLKVKSAVEGTVHKVSADELVDLGTISDELGLATMNVDNEAEYDADGLTVTSQGSSESEGKSTFDSEPDEDIQIKNVIKRELLFSIKEKITDKKTSLTKKVVPESKVKEEKVGCRDRDHNTNRDKNVKILRFFDIVCERRRFFELFIWNGLFRC